jgi:tRNA(Ile)-lysidine synthase
VCAADAADAPVSAAEAERLFEPFSEASAIVLAVSGGPDSTALLVLAARWRAACGEHNGPRIVAATIDHGLRPQSAVEARDVKRLARTLGVSHRTLLWRGKKPRTGIQQAARAARYRLLGQLAHTVKADHIFTAHTLDDQAETVLMRMSRGSGITGLAAMRQRILLPVSSSSKRDREVMVARPLLGVPKARLLATLARAGVSYADDASNRDSRFARARLREVMPVLAREGLDPRRLALLAHRLARADAALECAVESALVETHLHTTMARKRTVVLDARKFMTLPEEIAIRLLSRAITHAAKPMTIRLGKLELMHQALLASMRTAPVQRGRLRRTLAGALVTLSGPRLVVERAPPRSRPLHGRRRMGARARK